MFEKLTEKLGGALRDLRGVRRLSEENMADALKEVRNALLAADVHFKVAREFIDKVKAETLGGEVLDTVAPGQQAVNIIHAELVKLLGEGATELATKRPLRIMLVGLHGSGKTTSAAKLGRLLAQRRKLLPMLVACDVYRPAAIDQLETLAAQESLLFFADRRTKDVASIARQALNAAAEQKADAIIFDTAGRLQIDHDLIEEIKKMRAGVNPDEVLLVADAALGQEAVNVARHFHEAVQLTGIVMTKLDGDARGGAALSMKAVTGVPIKFAGTGEKPSDFEVFHPDRMASRILGMGDVVSLVERAQETIDQEEAERMAEKLRRADFNLEDFLSQLKQLKKLGSMESILGMLPGMSNVKIGENEEKHLARAEAIILSMTKRERRRPELLDGSRRLRIANGSGARVSDVNQLLKQYNQIRKVMKAMRGGKGKKMLRSLQSRMGGGGAMQGRL